MWHIRVSMLKVRGARNFSKPLHGTRCFCSTDSSEPVTVSDSRFKSNGLKSSPASLKPRNAELQQFALPAYFEFSHEDAKIFRSRELNDVQPVRDKTCESVDALLASTFNIAGPPLSKSYWDKPSHRISAVLYPNKILEKYRKQPFYRPHSHITVGSARFKGKDSTKQLPAALEQVALKNRNRLDALWTLSSSHGLSWSRVDQLYMFYMNKHQLCLEKFQNAEPALWKEAASIASDLISKARQSELESMNVDLATIPEQSELRRPRSQFRRLAKS